MVVLTGAAVALAVVLSALACYLAVQRSLRSRLDHQLQAQTALIVAAAQAHTRLPRAPRTGPASAPPIVRLPQPSLQTQGDIELLSASGAILRRPGDRTTLKLVARDLAVARGLAKSYFRDGEAGSTPVRVYVAYAGQGHAVISIQALTDLTNTLHDLAEILLAITLAGAALAGLLGLLVARTAAAPVHLLRQATEHVRSTGDLTRRIRGLGADDLGKLGRSFNEMLDTLEESRRAQRQLVADASHELRTPVATIRTNLEVLARNPDLAASDRDPLIEDLIGESVELGNLIEDLLETARESDVEEPIELVRLDAIIISELERWRRRQPRTALRCSALAVVVVEGRPSRLRRALANLLDNAIKWSPPDSAVDVSLAGGTLTVRDHGPGFTAADLPYVFDRFYRAPSARAVPGSGLGLSIVRKVAEEHGATAAAENAEGGGAVVTLTFPSVSPVPDDAAHLSMQAAHNPLPGRSG
jgi:two-component system sensor histidine kinase MprB